MPHLTVYHIYPHSGFHFGQRGVELEKTGTHFPSDSLFSAFMVAAIQAGYDPEALAEQFPRSAGQPAVEPPFLLTSLFPRAGDVRFYPALPLSLMLSAEALQRLHEANRLKEVKKIAYISEALFEALCQGTKLDDWLPGQPPQLAEAREDSRRRRVPRCRPRFSIPPPHALSAPMGFRRLFWCLRRGIPLFRRLFPQRHRPPRGRRRDGENRDEG